MRKITEFIAVWTFVLLFSFIFQGQILSQLSYQSVDPDIYDKSDNEYVSLIAYKLPFRGENYKFYGTLSYHIYGRAFVGCKVHNTVIEAYHLSEQTCIETSFKILKSSRRKNGRIIKNHSKKNGHHIIFMTPMLKKKKPIKHYYRTGIFRVFKRFDKSGNSKQNKKVEIDFENMAKHIINLDVSAKMYGLRIKKIIFNRFFLDELYSCPSGQKLKERDIYFAKFLSEKVNRKYDDLFYVEFVDIK